MCVGARVCQFVYALEVIREEVWVEELTKLQNKASTLSAAKATPSLVLGFNIQEAGAADGPPVGGVCNFVLGKPDASRLVSIH